MKYLSDDQFDDLMDHLQGLDETQTEGMKTLGFEGMKLTKDQIRHRDENWKRCRRCKRWISVYEECNCG